MPQSLLMEVFEINEQLEEVKAGRASIEQVDSLRAQIKEKRERLMWNCSKASSEWDDIVKERAAESSAQGPAEKADRNCFGIILHTKSREGIRGESR